MVEFDDMSEESIIKAFKRKFGEDLEEQMKENYCVVSFEEVEFDSDVHDLLFANGAKVCSRGDGGGIYVLKRFIEFVGVYGDTIDIRLKGTKKKRTDYDEILYDSKKR